MHVCGVYRESVNYIIHKIVFQQCNSEIFYTVSDLPPLENSHARVRLFEIFDLLPYITGRAQNLTTDFLLFMMY